MLSPQKLITADANLWPNFHRTLMQVLQISAYVMPNQDLAVVGAIAYMVLVFQLGGFFRASADMISFCRGLG